MRQPAEVVYHHIRLACLVTDDELERLQGEVSPSKATVVVLHGVDPHQGPMISLQITLLPQQVVVQALQCPLNDQTFFLHCGVPGLTRLKFAAQVQDWMLFSGVPLGQDCSKADC